MKKVFLSLLLLLIILPVAGCQNQTEEPAKPVIYLYPEVETETTVTLDYIGEITSTYPAYEDGWTIVAHPDGTLIDPDTGREYYCLFWEGRSDFQYDLSEGFVVAGKDTADFLENALSELGLNDQEANEFIIYWLPQMEANPYNLISFQNEPYAEHAVLSVTPTPDSVLRVFMVWKALDTPITVTPQIFPSFERNGFTVVEWGGTQIKS